MYDDAAAERPDANQSTSSTHRGQNVYSLSILMGRKLRTRLACEAWTDAKAAPARIKQAFTRSSDQDSVVGREIWRLMPLKPNQMKWSCLLRLSKIMNRIGMVSWKPVLTGERAKTSGE